MKTFAAIIAIAATANAVGLVNNIVDGEFVDYFHANTVNEMRDTFFRDFEAIRLSSVGMSTNMLAEMDSTREALDLSEGVRDAATEVMKTEGYVKYLDME